MPLDSIKNWFSEQSDNMQDLLKRYKNKEFLDGVVAGCALVAAADGSIGPEEKQKMVAFIQRSEELKVFELRDVIGRFNRFAEGFEFDYEIGKAEALKSVGKMKSDVNAARLLARICIAIARSDGTVHPDEIRMIREIAQELGINADELLN
jgi:tellurite resistance protein TerB